MPIGQAAGASAEVAFGAPILALAGVTGMPLDDLAAIVGR
jgi:hypothetical protein